MAFTPNIFIVYFLLMYKGVNSHVTGMSLKIHTFHNTPDFKSLESTQRNIFDQKII